MAPSCKPRARQGITRSAQRAAGAQQISSTSVLGTSAPRRDLGADLGAWDQHPRGHRLRHGLALVVRLGLDRRAERGLPRRVIDAQGRGASRRAWAKPASPMGGFEAMLQTRQGSSGGPPGERDRWPRSRPPGFWLPVIGCYRQSEPRARAPRRTGRDRIQAPRQGLQESMAGTKLSASRSTGWGATTTSLSEMSDTIAGLPPQGQARTSTK